MNRDRLLGSLVLHEGIRLTPYLDSLGVETIGIGRNLKVGISTSEAYVLANNDIDKVVKGVTAGIDFFPTLSDVRQNVLLEMAFQLGLSGLFAFRKLLGYLRTAQWSLAAAEGRASAWHTQTPQRCETLMKMLESDAWSNS